MLSSEPSSRYPSVVNEPYAIGIGYVFSVLEKAGYDVKVVVSSNEDEETSDNRYFAAYDDFKPDVVGFSMFSSNRVSTFQTIEKLKALPKPPRIILGGIHPTVMYEQIITKYPHVVVVRGEGEVTILELLEALESGAGLEQVKGLAFQKDGRVVLTGQRDLIHDLDSIPFPKHEAFFDPSPCRTTAVIMTSRGCPSRCTFCCLMVMSRGKSRKRSIQNTVDEIKYLKRKYPAINHIKMLDDTFLLDNARVIEFCKMVIAADLGITFGCIARVKPISGEMFDLMEKAGFVTIEFGLETGSPKMLKSIQKGITQEDVVKLMKMVEPYKFVVNLLVMCGFPGETEETVHESVAFIQSLLKKNYARVTAIGRLEIFPGTEVYETAKRAGAISDDYWLTDKRVPYYTVDHDLAKLTEFENYILDRTSVRRAFTPNGLKYQFLRMPGPIIRHLLKHKNFIPHVAAWTVQCTFPRAYAGLKSVYSRVRALPRK